jgi:hypothetical protein
MNAKQALAQARKRWGKAAGVQDNGPKRASTPEKRAEATKQHKEFVENLKATKGDRKNWSKEEREQASTLMFNGWRHRYSVGRVMLGMFFEVKAEGDTWEEAFLTADHVEALSEDHTRSIIAERKQHRKAA